MPITDIDSYVTTGQEFDSHWVDVNADRTANALSEFAFPDGYAKANFAADVAATAAAITLRDRMVQYRQGIEVEYGEQHPFTQSLPDVYPSNGGGGGGPTFEFHSIIDGEGNLVLWFLMPPGVPGVTNILVREGAERFSTGVVLEPGQSQQLVWSGVTISGEIAEVVLRDAENNVLATGVRNPELPDPGP